MIVFISYYFLICCANFGLLQSTYNVLDIMLLDLSGKVVIDKDTVLVSMELRH